MQKRFQKLLLIMVTMFVPWIIQAQSLGDYTFSTGVDTTKWIDMSSATQILTPSNSDALASSVQDIGFAFPFGDEDYTQYSVNTDGNLRLGSTVTGTSNCNTPFSSTYANINNPKINFFGCDGFGVADSHYVKAINTVDATGDSMLVVEFCMGTFNTTTRNNLYKWQVHLYPNGNIEIVYGAYPATGPAVSRQIGLCINASDGWTVSHYNHGANHFTGGTPYSSVGVWEWPTQGRYYRFAMPIYSCPKPTHIAVSNLVANHFDINWTDTSAATAWIVRLTGNDTIIYDSVVSSCSVSFTGLESATRYRVQVAGLCPNGDTSLFRTTKVLTPCALLTRLPYTQNFDNEEGATTTSVPTNNLPPCWNYLNHGTRSNYTGYPAVYSSATYSHSGSNSMRFYSFYTAADSAQYAILPPTDSTIYPLNNLMLTFQMRARNTGSTYAAVAVIGVMTNPTDASTFVPVDTVNSNGVTTYSGYEVSFASYTGPHGYVTMMFPYAAHVGFSYNAGYVDDIVLDVLPTCLPVSNLMVTGVNDGSISLSWSPTGSETSWIVSDGTNDYMVSDTVYTLTGLSATTTYLISVRAYCDGDTSAAVAVTATTTCGVITALPFVENFDGVTGSTTLSLATNNLPSCWSNYNTGTNTSYSGYPIVYSNSTYAHSGTNCMRFFNNGQAHFSDQIAVMPMTDSLTLPLQGLQVSFWLRDAGLNSLVVGVMTDPTDRTTFVAVDTISTNGSSTYGQHTVRLDSYNGPHGRVAFMAPQGSAGFVLFFIDDVVLESLAVCPPVQNLTALNIAPNSVDVRWTETGSASTWYVTYMPVGYSLDSAVTLVTHDTTVTITGLAANTDYTVMVVANCDSMTSDTGVVTFHTPCNYITSLPYVENFDGVIGSTSTTLATNNLPACWGYYNTGTSPAYSGYPIVYSSSAYAHSGTNSMRFYTYITAGTFSDQIAVMPMTDSTTLPVSGLQVSFWTSSTATAYNSYVVVGVMSDPTDAATFVPIDTIRTNGSTSYTNHTVMLGRYAGPHGHIAFKVPQPASSVLPHNALVIDDITIDYMPACPDVTDLYADNVTSNSVTLHWDNDPMAQSWIIEYGFQGFDQGTGTMATSSTNSYTVSGLLDDMDYDFLVRAVCGDNWQSEGVASVTATTQAGTVTCDAPIGVSAVVAGNAATVSWMSGAGNISFQIEYGTRDFAHGAGTTITTNASPAMLSGLNYETEYDVYVKAYCGGDAYSAWSTVASFTTEPEGSQDCDPVTDLAASNVTENSALISWTPDTTGDEWEVVLTYAAGVTVSEASTTERQYLLNGLTPSTAYIAKVRTVCGDGQYSTFVSTSFTTVSAGIDNVEGTTCAIYPNPTSGATTIRITGITGKVKITVIDITGREVVVATSGSNGTLGGETLDCSGDCAKTMDVDRLGQGAYFVRITGENVSMVRKLIVR